MENSENAPENQIKKVSYNKIQDKKTNPEEGGLTEKALAAPTFKPNEGRGKGGGGMIPKLGLESAGLAAPRTGAKTARQRNAPFMPFRNEKGNDGGNQEEKKQKPRNRNDNYNPTNMPLTARGERKSYNQPMATDRTPQQKNQKDANKGKKTQQDVRLTQMKETYVKYKTTMCRHWQETQTCALGDACAFAHGEHQKRGINDPVPESFPGMGQVGAVHSNYKTSVCKNFEETGQCKYGPSCCFAHGHDELRALTDPMPAVPQEVLMFSPPNMRLMPPTGSIQVLPSQTKAGETPVLPLSSNTNSDQPVNKEFQEAYSKALQMQAALLPGKQQVVTYNFAEFTDPNQAKEEIKNMPKPGQTPAQEAKPFNKPEVIQETKKEEGEKKNNRNKQDGGDKKQGGGGKPHKKKIYNY